MPLDKQTKALLEQMALAPTWYQIPLDESRKQRVISAPVMNGASEDVSNVENRTVPGPGGEIPIRIYTPGKETPYPVLVYFHGGGWVLSNLDTHDILCRRVANRADCIVVSVDYRLAPEHKFPAAVEDSYAAVQWVAEQARTLGGDPTRIAVGGDSAGGNLSAVVTLLARDQRGPSLIYQFLIYPATDYLQDAIKRPSYRENGDGYFLTREGIERFLNHYLTHEEDGKDVRFAPLRAESLRDLPPALIVTAEFDPLRDEGELYAERLREAGVPVTLKRYDGMIHGFFTMAGFIDKSRLAIDETTALLRAALRS